jgi:cytochrome c-type biogenesis protein CcmF
MLAEVGVWLLCIALLLSVLPLVPASLLRLPISWRTLASLQWATISAAMGILIVLFMDSDFSVAVVASNSHTQKPLIYKIAAAWGQHEGSMLLWALVLAGAGAFWAARHEHDSITPMAMRVQSALLAGTLAFLLITSNPFERLWLVPEEGQGLNPLLQDVGLALHPPLLYFGYVGLSLVFSLAVAAMRSGTLDAEWARKVRPWVLWPWASLTIGIGLGSWWAYRELGWGGWWFWDPVENASFIPWLIATALFHSIVVLERRNQFARWVGLLATLGFACSLLGTFLVRSGVLTSVHAFASDPARGVYILLFLAIAVGYALWVYGNFAANNALRESTQPVALSSRAHALLLNNLLLIVIAATVLTGTLYPVILQALDAPPVSVGAPYYLTTLSPIAAVLLVLGGIAPLMAWPGTPARMLLRRLSWMLVLVGMVAVAQTWQKPAMALGICLGVWVAAGSILSLRQNRSLRNFGMVISHAALGLFIASACINHATKQEFATRLQQGQRVQLGTHQVTLERISHAQQDNYLLSTAHVLLEPPYGLKQIRLAAEERDYPTEKQKTNEAAIAMDMKGEWYAVAQFLDPKTVQLRLMREPMIPWLWLALAFMGFGGLCSAIARPRRIEQ